MRTFPTLMVCVSAALLAEEVGALVGLAEPTEEAV